MAVLIVATGCSSTVEYGRRSINEPQFPLPMTPEKRVSVIVSSTARQDKSTDDSASTPGSSLPNEKVILNFTNPKAEDIDAIRKANAVPQERTQFLSDRTVAKRIIVVTVARSSYRPADRFVNYRLHINPKNFEFVDYVGAETDYLPIPIESFGLTKSRNVGTKLSGGAPMSVELSLGADRSQTEAGQVGVRIENTTANIDHGFLDVYREGERGIDLSGNTLVGVSVTAKKALESQQFDFHTVVTALSITREQKDLAPRHASMQTSMMTALKPVDLLADIDFDYVIRHATSRSNEYAEYNQTVSYEEGRCQRENVVIVRGRDLEIRRWRIVEFIPGDGQVKDSIGSTLQVETDLGRRSFQFLDYFAALRFAHWMSKFSATAIGERSLFLAARGSIGMRAPTENTLARRGKKVWKYPALIVVPAGEKTMYGTTPVEGASYTTTPADTDTGTGTPTPDLNGGWKCSAVFRQ